MTGKARGSHLNTSIHVFIAKQAILSYSSLKCSGSLVHIFFHLQKETLLFMANKGKRKRTKLHQWPHVGIRQTAFRWGGLHMWVLLTTPV